MIEGCGNEQGKRNSNSTALHRGALCVVIGMDEYGQASILYENANCTTIPDYPLGFKSYCDSYNEGGYIPTLVDGMYLLKYCNHDSKSLGSYGAMKVYGLGGGSASVMRWNYSKKTFVSDTSSGINVHARTFSTCSSSTYSSVGCQLIGQDLTEYLSFAKAAGILPTTASTMRQKTKRDGEEAGLLIVDRSVATARVNLTSIYGEDGYNAITGR